jgi:hypothetical protein
MSIANRSGREYQQSDPPKSSPSSSKISPPPNSELKLSLSTVAGLHLKLASSHHFPPSFINEAPQILIHLAAKHPCIPCKPNLSAH